MKQDSMSGFAYLLLIINIYKGYPHLPLIELGLAIINHLNRT